MSTCHVLVAVSLALGSIAVPSAWAQDKSTPSSLAPAGQGPGVNASSPATSGKSTKSRAGVKAETKTAEQSGKLQAAGEAPNPTGSANPAGDKAMTSTGSTRSRAGVKSETKAAESSGSLQPAGQAPQPSGEAPKK